MRERLERVAAEVVERGDKVRAAALELESHIAADHALPLLLEVTRLHHRVRELTDEGPRRAGSTEAGPPLAAIHPLEVIGAGVRVAQHVDEPFSQLRRRLGDEALLREFARREAEQRKDVEFRRYMHEQDEWLANWGRNTDEIVREMNTALAELQQALGSDEPGE